MNILQVEKTVNIQIFAEKYARKDIHNVAYFLKRGILM